MSSVHWQDAVALDAPAPPCQWNPSAWSHRVPIAVLAGIATVLASYMALFQWGLIGYASAEADQVALQR